MMMERTDMMDAQQAVVAGETQGARRASGVSPARGGVERGRAADPEVPAKAKRRQFAPEYKQRILREAAAASAPGEIGALLRREGLYSSHLITWRRQRERGELAGLSAKQRGRKAKAVNPLAKRVAELERDKRRLERKLEQAELLLDIQKKASRLLEIPLRSPDDDGSA
jgi:transposase-like protein